MSEFYEAIRSAGMTPPVSIQAGKLYRFAGIGKANGNKSGWCLLFNDGEGGSFGDWSTGLTENWQANKSTPFTKEEKRAFALRIKQAKKEEEEAQIKRRALAASKAKACWDAATESDSNHPYLISKGILPHGIRQAKSSLLIPLTIDGIIYSLQFINHDGDKRFLTGGRVKGCYYLIGDIEKDKILIAEGYATGATLHEETGYPVVIAFNAGNLKPVAQLLRKKYPSKKLIVCGDNDSETPNNPGVTKATEAAQSAGAYLTFPEFLPGEVGSDWNDWHQLRSNKQAISHG